MNSIPQYQIELKKILNSIYQCLISTDETSLLEKINAIKQYYEKQKEYQENTFQRNINFFENNELFYSELIYQFKKNINLKEFSSTISLVRTSDYTFIICLLLLIFDKIDFDDSITKWIFFYMINILSEFENNIYLIDSAILTILDKYRCIFTENLFDVNYSSNFFSTTIRLHKILQKQ